MHVAEPDREPSSPVRPNPINSTISFPLRQRAPWSVAGRGLARPLVGAIAVVIAVAAACTAPPAGTPPITPGTSTEPREVNVVARDYSFLPPVIDLVPGETVLLHVVNGGLEIHEAIFGDDRVQAAWEEAEAATVGAPPGPTPAVSVPPDVAGLRVVVRSGERADVVWTVPADAAEKAWSVGCHIPGHWARGMAAPVRWVGADGVPLDGQVP